MIEIPLPKLLPTPNVISRLHWATIGRIRKDLHELAFLYARQAEWPRAYKKVDLVMTLVRGKGQRMLDLDNAIAALKPCVDGLKDAGVIVDDSPKWVEIHYRQERGENPMLRIGITE